LDFERFVEQRARGVSIAGFLKRLREVVHADERVGVFLAEHSSTNLDGAVFEGTGALEIPLSL